MQSLGTERSFWDILPREDEKPTNAKGLAAESCPATTIGYELGYAAGQRDGRQDAYDQLAQTFAERSQKLTENVEMFLQTAEVEQKEMSDRIASSAARLALEIARKILRTQISDHPDLVLETVKHAIRRAVGSGNIVLRVNPHDIGIVRDHRADFVTILDGIQHIEIVDDRRVGNGGCVIDTGTGSIDARIETQLDWIEQNLHLSCD
jgi:flagellar assembly protein FliH